MRNAHEYADGTDFLGRGTMRIPNRMLRNVYGIPDPDTMTPGSITGTITGGSGSVSTSQEFGADAMHVDFTGVTFSRHPLRVKAGVIISTRPTSLHAVRTRPHAGRVSFDWSHPRGLGSRDTRRAAYRGLATASRSVMPRTRRSS
jgi:hypothetical protein